MTRIHLYLLGVWLTLIAANASELHFSLGAEPKTVDPFLVADESAEALRYLTEGALIRVNRQTQLAEPELAVSWKVLDNGARIQFQLRRDVKFPDGAPFTSADVVDSFTKLLAPELHSPIADTFRTEKGRGEGQRGRPVHGDCGISGARSASRAPVRSGGDRFRAARLRARRRDWVLS